MLVKLMKHVSALEKKVLELHEELEENNRASANLIRLGVVANAEQTTVDIQTGDNLVKRIPFFVLASGRVSQYRRPSVNEQCLLINLGSGDSLNNAVALMGLPSTNFPCPTTKENEVMTDYGNGMSELYNLDDGSMVCRYPGGVKIYGDTWQDGSYQATGDITDHTRSMQADREIYNEHEHPGVVPGPAKTKPTEEQQ
ncbi:Phage baseplate assembly protein V [Vibrio sp. AND4]|uniref:phage baseplate assembly protein V n=1 Tax=Vibrio sp. AND4 TaxID=314289 RepID=UPI00015F2F4D|nr:phage baseplate assembly protein V [Vibrio sp. AND4]EDP60853.1 Phage baseplate assembly protein V [Vibrio sp. AND4]